LGKYTIKKQKNWSRSLVFTLGVACGLGLYPPHEYLSKKEKEEPYYTYSSRVGGTLSLLIDARPNLFLKSGRDLKPTYRYKTEPIP
jgi:hypothetical protein